MELVNARSSRTVLTADSEVHIIAAVRQVTLGSIGLTQELSQQHHRDLDIFDFSVLQMNSTVCSHIL
jgi:hypothetical protein